MILQGNIKGQQLRGLNRKAGKLRVQRPVLFAPALGVTAFINVRDMILVSLCCATIYLNVQQTYLCCLRLYHGKNCGYIYSYDTFIPMFLLLYFADNWFLINLLQK
jgi:hypothetical protein